MFFGYYRGYCRLVCLHLHLAFPSHTLFRALTIMLFFHGTVCLLRDLLTFTTATTSITFEIFKLKLSRSTSTVSALMVGDIASVAFNSDSTQHTHMAALALRSARYNLLMFPVRRSGRGVVCWHAVADEMKHDVYRSKLKSCASAREI